MSTSGSRPLSLDGRGPYSPVLDAVHLDLLTRLVKHMIVAVDDGHVSHDVMPGEARQLRGALIETIDRLNEARRRGPVR